MGRRIAIVGAGTAGLQLAYSLKNEFDVTVLHYEEPHDIRRGRIQSTQVHFHPTLEREQRALMPSESGAPSIGAMHITLGQQKLFVGRLENGASSIDQRLAHAIGLEDLARQGVRLLKGRMNREELKSLSQSYDLVIDATGKAGPVAPFPVIAELSPYQTPQRKCIVGYFKGVAPVEPAGISFTALPGTGEMFEIPALTEYGPVTILFIEAVPEGALDAFKGVKAAQEFTDRMKSVVLQFFPEIHSRIDPDRFSLAEESSFLQTAITPVVRRPYALVNGNVVVGCGDSVILNDPITGQGCNTASYCAERLADLLLASKDAAWDEQVGIAYWNDIRPYVTAVTEWTNAMLGPLPAPIGQKFMQAAGDQSAADAVAHWFEDPRKAYEASSGN